MKKILLIALGAVVLLLGSCSKQDDNNPEQSNPVKISIDGVKYIYENPQATKTSSGELAKFMGVTDKGERKPIRFLNANNDTIDMYIENIKNLGDEYVILDGNFSYTDKAGTAYFRNMLANKKTGLVYAMNTNFYLDPSPSRILTCIDQNNNLYQQTNRSDYMIYQYNVSDPNNIRLSEYIPKDLSVGSEFIVNKRGFCFFQTYPYWTLDFRFKCPGGRIYLMSELLPEGVTGVSIFKGYNNDDFFMVTDGAYNNQTGQSESICYELVENGLNELVVTQRGAIKLRNGDYSLGFSNHIRKTHLMQSYSNDYILEYDDETNQFTELNLPLPYLIRRDDKYKSITKNNLFIYDKDKNELVMLKLADNTVTRINLGGKYELLSMDGASDADEVTFSGLRLSDGRNIVGTIDERGQFHVIETINATKETVLIRLN